jgi:acyl-CoA dehydrogenase
MNAPSEIRAMLVESATRLFADHVDARTLEAAKRDGWSAVLWTVMESAELPRVSVPEEAGGAGGTLSDLAAVLRVAGRYAAPVPFAETALLANWLLAGAGLELPRGPLAVLPGAPLSARHSKDGWVVSGVCSRVPWARIAARLVGLAHADRELRVVMVDPGACRVAPGRNLAGEPRDRVTLDHVPVLLAAPAKPGITVRTLRQRAALGRALLMAGALERALELSIEYAKQRVQFGRPIAQFQAIQHELARAGGEVAVAVAAALLAAGAVERGGDALAEVAAAKICAADAAREVALIAHQVHGAIGVTEEHPLHHSTLRLWAWRDEDGNEAEWSMALGGEVQRLGADALWPLLARDMAEQ